MNIFDFNSTFSGDQTALYGKSTEEKPTPETNPGVFAQSNVVVYRELDTGNDYYYDEDEGDWSVMKTGGGGGGSSLPPVTEDDNGDVLSVVDGAWAKSEPKGGDWNASYGEAGYIENRPFYSESVLSEVEKQIPISFDNDCWYDNDKYWSETISINSSYSYYDALKYAFEVGQSIKVLFTVEMGQSDVTLLREEQQYEDTTLFLDTTSDIELAITVNRDVDEVYVVTLVIPSSTILNYLPWYSGTTENPDYFYLVPLSVPMSIQQEKVEKIDLKYMTEELYIQGDPFTGLNRLYKDKHFMEGVKPSEFPRLVATGIISDEWGQYNKFVASTLAIHLQGNNSNTFVMSDCLGMLYYNQDNSSLDIMPFLPGFSSDDDYVLAGYYAGLGIGSNIELLLNNFKFSFTEDSVFAWNGVVSEEDCLKINNALKVMGSYGQNLCLSLYGNSYSSPWAESMKGMGQSPDITKTIDYNTSTVTVSKYNDSSVVYIVSTPTTLQLNLPADMAFDALYSGSTYSVLDISLTEVWT